MKNPFDDENFAQNHMPIKIKCPFCLRKLKCKRQVHEFKCISGLWWHIKNEHIDLSIFEFNWIIEVLKKISRARYNGMI